ncbi:hypothetical protein GCM10011380_07770 [Sphingomonas metalli]|uniref:ATP-dependent RNA helicase n=1 Tax=Sphingomonas metalli TaxID=1779358 RepID=A0A916WQN2_9SPHN|nr:RcnB family protein [Sphingomonas metalli]GGB20629.1 hypothetical protein GCM10011380_07770 [Sphingomonas metalli]
MRKLIGALLAAAMVTPVAAEAQRGRFENRPDGEARPAAPRQGWGGRQWNGPRPDGGGGRMAPPQDAGSPPPAPRFEPQAPAANRPLQEGRRDFDRRDDGRGDPGRNTWRNDGPRPDGERRYEGPRPDGPRPDRPGEPRRDGGWRSAREENGVRVYDRRVERDRPLSAGRRDADRRYGWDGGRNDRGGYGDRSRWDRGWRGESRFDWMRWREANRDAYRLPRYYAPYDWNGGYRRFGIGITLSSGLWGRNYWIDDPWDYRLPEAYGPYRWIRYYDDALLVDLETGQVVDAVYGIFW